MNILTTRNHIIQKYINTQCSGEYKPNIKHCDETKFFEKLMIKKFEISVQILYNHHLSYLTYHI